MHIYVIAHRDQNDFDRLIGPVKIGVTKNLKERLASLQTGNPSTLAIYASFEMPEPLCRQVERELHDGLQECRLNGEWFDMECHHAANSCIFWMKVVEAVGRRGEA